MSKEPHFIDVGDIQLATWEHGHGEPFVLVHGFTGSSLDWVDVVDPLAATHRVLTLDQRGHGRSSNTGDEATYSFDQLVADFGSYVDAVGLESFHLLGHSMGGMMAMRYALAAPDRLKSLILMDTAAAPAKGAPEMMRTGLQLAREHGLNAVFEAISPFLATSPRGEITLERMRTKWGQMDVAAFLALGAELLEHESVLDQLATLRIPTTVILGENDHGLRHASEALAAAIPGAHFAIIPNAGHSPQEDDPAAWLAAVAAHFERSAASAG